MWTESVGLLLCALFALGYRLALRRRGHPPFPVRHRPKGTAPRVAPGIRQPKPPWVRKEVICLKALMPQHGCRAIASVFCQMHAKRGMSVGKSFVAEIIRRHPLEIQNRRRELRRKAPRPLPKNLIWATDLTLEKGDKEPQPILGILDHGTRACLSLRQLRTKTSITLLRELLDAIEKYGRPKILRTDNEPVFTSVTFRTALRLLGIRHQRIIPAAPWQNGRIERFFGTLKRALRDRTHYGVEGTVGQEDLDLFRFWYNHARPHQNLAGDTPAMAWKGKNRTQRRSRFVQIWEGALRGYFIPT